MTTARFQLRWGLFLAVFAASGGCDTRDADMYYQPRHDPYDASTVFADGKSARPLVPGTIARPAAGLGGALYYKDALPGGGAPPPAGGGFPADFPADGPALQAALARGRERFNIYCSLCHGMTGHGDGMIVRRGFTPPPSFHLVPTDETNNPPRYARELFLQTAPPRHVYDVLTNGFGAMYPYADRVSPEDRWKIAAYVKALQLARPPPAAAVPGADETRARNN